MKQRTEKKLAINSFDEVNEAIRCIALEEASIEKATASMNKKIINVKKEYEPVIKASQKRISKLEKDIEKFMQKNKSVFDKIRSKVLTFGRVGFNRGQLHLDKTKDATWKIITDKFFEIWNDKFVKVTMKLKKDDVINALKKGEITKSQIELTGAKVIQEDRTYYKPFKHKIQSADSNLTEKQK